MERFKLWVLVAAMIMPQAALAQDTPDEGGGVEGGDVESGDVADDTQTTAEPTTNAPEDDYTEPTQQEVELSDEQILYEEKTGKGQVEDTTDPIEYPDEEYHFIGLSFRNVMVPDFIIDIFTDVYHNGEPWAFNPTFGLEYTYRTDGFSVVVNGLYSDFGGVGAFKPKGDPDDETEIWESDISMLWLHASLLWSTEFNKYVALEYGVGVGVGLVLGDLKRTEATFDGTQWRKCNEATERGVAMYCDATSAEDGEDGGHYNVTATKWLDDGGGNAVPNVWPWLALPHLALRIKPIKQLQIRVEGGFNVWGFFYGASLSYGL